MGMLIGFTAAALLLACLLFSGDRCFAQAPSNPPPASSAPPAATSTEKIKSLDRATIRGLLKKLADTPVAKGKRVNAMCYSVSLAPTRADYVCPKCGERTLYDSDKLTPDGRTQKDSAEFMQRTLPACRLLFKDLQKVAGEAITLDESQFCKKCSPKATEPTLVLHIAYKDEKARDVENVQPHDLLILREFLAGELLTEEFGKKTMPLKEYLPRLQELLGVKLDKSEGK
jgi:hypothetical protein